MITHRASAALAGVVTFGLLLTGCAGGSDPGSDTPAPTAPPAASDSPSPDSTDTGSTDTGSEGTGQAAASDGSGVAVDEVRDGTWQVGDAGELDFTVESGALSLGEVRPADGWEQRISDEKPDEIEVHFTQGDQEWKFEVEVDDGRLQISKQLKIRNASSADFAVGSAATLTFTADGNALSVADITPADGWSITKQDESADDIELEFQKGDSKAEFEAETDRGGVKVEISQKMRGPIG